MKVICYYCSKEIDKVPTFYQVVNTDGYCCSSCYLYISEVQEKVKEEEDRSRGGLIMNYPYLTLMSLK